MSLVVGIDASRNRSGGAKAHLVGILGDSDPTAHGIDRVHLWSYRSLLDAVPDRPWLVKHNPAALERSLLSQLWWQYRALPREARAAGCGVLLNTDAGTVCPFRPAVTMSRDMLSYEPGERQRYGFSRARLRLEALRHIQARSLRAATGAVFLTRHAAEVITAFTGPLPNVAIIPHGIGAEFRRSPVVGQGSGGRGEPIHCLYVSNAAMYKHQWHVVRAFGMLRERGHRITLTLAGGGSGPAQRRLDTEIARTDPTGALVRTVGAVEPGGIPALLATTDVFVFASSCENMPNTLLEAMASGLPIASSNRGPMPEVLGNAGEFFNPEDPSSIADAVERILRDPEHRKTLACRAHALSMNYSWTRCGNETWIFLRDTAERFRMLSDENRPWSQ